MGRRSGIRSRRGRRGTQADLSNDMKADSNDTYDDDDHSSQIYLSFVSGAKFGMVVAVLVLLISAVKRL